MKRNFRLLRSFAVIGFVTCSVFTAEAQTNETKKTTIENPEKSGSNKETVKDSTFPRFVNTGDPTADNARYRAEKDKWIAENPEKYKQMTTNQTPKK